MTDDSTCPYCGVIAEKPYSKKRACKGCGKQVYYSKRYPFIYNRRTLSLDEVKLLDFFQTVTALLNIENEEEVYGSMYDSTIKQFGIAKPYDVAWGLANSADRYIKFETNEVNSAERRLERMFTILGFISLARARFMPYYDNRYSPKPYLRTKLNYSLQIFKYNKINELAIYATQCCRACVVNDGIKLSLSAAEATTIIPFDGCLNTLPGTEYSVCICEFIKADDYDVVAAM